MARGVTRLRRSSYPILPMTTRVSLREVEAGDLPAFYDHQLDPEATRMAVFSARDRDAFMTHWAKSMADATSTLRAIIFEGKVAGNIVCWEQSGQHTVGYWIGRDYWGRGVASEALSQFIAQVKLRPLVAHVAKHNVASLRVLQKCGFVVSGEATNPGGEEYLLMLEA